METKSRVLIWVEILIANFFNPIITVRIGLNIAVLFFYFCLHEHGMISKKNISFPKYSYFYIFTVISSYFIHYYRFGVMLCVDFIINFILIRYVILNSVNDDDDFEKILDFLILVFSIYAVLGIIESITTFNLFDVIAHREIDLNGANTFRGSFYRNHGFCGVSINNGMIMAMTLMLASYKSYKYHKFKYYISSVLIIADIIMIYSRAVILIAVISQLIMFTHIKGSTRLQLVTIATIAVSIGVMVFPEQISQMTSGIEGSFKPLVDEFLMGGYRESGGITAGGSGHRLALWGWVISSVKGNMFFGVGFETAFSYGHYENGFYLIKESIENHWLYLLYQTGLFGLIGFIIYEVGCVYKCISMVWCEKKEYMNFSFVFLLITIGYFLSLLSCAGFQDLMVYYCLFSLFEVYERNHNKHQLEEKHGFKDSNFRSTY